MYLYCAIVPLAVVCFPPFCDLLVILFGAGGVPKGIEFGAPSACDMGTATPSMATTSTSAAVAAVGEL